MKKTVEQKAKDWITDWYDTLERKIDELLQVTDDLRNDRDRLVIENYKYKKALEEISSRKVRRFAINDYMRGQKEAYNELARMASRVLNPEEPTEH